MSYGSRGSRNRSNSGNSRSGFGNSRSNSRGRFSRNRYKSRVKNPSLDRAIYVNTGISSEDIDSSVQEIEYEPSNQFTEFGLHESLVKNIADRNFTTPTPIQDQAIPSLMAGRDVVGIANTGTGKTAAFLLPFLHKVMQDDTQGVLVLAPTRELALQIFEELKLFAKGCALGVSLCIGGMNIQRQIDRLRANPHFVIGTPGRIKDLLQRRAFKPELFTNIVLDEVDRMLDIGFRKDIQYLIDQLSTPRHGAFFSATMNRETEEIMKQLLTDPVRITVSKKRTTNHIHQDIVKVERGQHKSEVLFDLLIQEEFERVLIFGSTKHGINKLEQTLYKRGIQVTSIHGNKNQNARQRSLDAFKSGRVQALLATDVVARGIDIDNITHVINYDEPNSYEDYIHRIGRTGRAGKSGKALTFIL